MNDGGCIYSIAFPSFCQIEKSVSLSYISINFSIGIFFIDTFLLCTFFLHSKIKINKNNKNKNKYVLTYKWTSGNIVIGSETTKEIKSDERCVGEKWKT